jgi:hypothetical protein
MLPALVHVRDAASKNDPPFTVAFLAATVSTSTRLAVAVATQRELLPAIISESAEEDVDLLQQRLYPLLESLEQTVLLKEEQLEPILCCHSWRQLDTTQQVLSSRNSSSREALLAYYTAADELFEDDTSLLGERNEQICFVETEWDTVGLALLVAVAWYKRPMGAWNPFYQWRLWFPHVSSLLKNNETCCQRLGFDLLADLVRSMPPRSLLAQPPQRKDEAPSPVIGTFQLLSNWIIASSEPEKQRQVALPSAGETFQYMRDLLSKYTPMAQFHLVHTLLQTCPHAGFQPKLLDLWRPFVTTWKDADAVQEVVRYLDESFLQVLEQEHIMETTSAVGVVLKDVQGLISSGESFGAALGLMQLWIKLGDGSGNIIIPLDLSMRFVRIDQAFEATTRRWGEDPPEDSFRLHLLHDTVRQTLQLLQEG